MKLSFCFSIFSQNRIFSLQNSQYFFELVTLEINAIWRIHYFLWCCLNTTVCEFNNFNFGNYLAAQNGQVNQVCSSKRYCHKIFLFQLSFACDPAFYFNMGKKLGRNISCSSTCSCYYRKYTNNDNKICLLEPFACFRQHFHDWFSELRYNSGLKNLEWTPLLLNSTKSVIWQIDANCSPPSSLNMLPFHIRPECLKLTHYSLISDFTRYYFKTGTLCLLFWYSHYFLL